MPLVISVAMPVGVVAAVVVVVVLQCFPPPPLFFSAVIVSDFVVIVASWHPFLGNGGSLLGIRSHPI